MILDTLLNVYILPLSVFVNDLLTMGLPVIDKNMDELLGAMAESPLRLNTLVGMARTIGSALALCAGSYECYMMMLGKRGIDVMKLLRILGIAICINMSPTICNMAKAPGMAMEKEMHTTAMRKNAEVDALQLKVAEKQKAYLDTLRDQDARMTEQAYANEMAKTGVTDVFAKGKILLNYVSDKIQDYAKQKMALAETKLGEWANDLIRFIGEVLFQMMYYGLFLAQRCFMAILGMFCPIAFALSLAPPFKNAWSQWLGKYLSLSLWGFVIYCVLYYTDFLMIYFLQQDMGAYTKLLGVTTEGTMGGAIKVLGIQSIGTSIAFVVSMFVGCKVLSFVPEVCSWLIPGGVSSGAGSAAMGAAGMVYGYAWGTTKSTAKSVVAAPVNLAKKVAK